MEWKRPIADFPRIWHRFQAKDRNSDELVNYVVQDVPENRFADAVQFMFKHFIPDEPLCQEVDLLGDSVSCETNADLYLTLLQNKLSLICFKEGSSEIVGLNILILSSKDNSHNYEFHGEKMKIVYGIFSHVLDQFDSFKFYDVDTYLGAAGLAVQPDFRQRGIASEILKARIPLCKAFDIKVTTTLFSSVGGQATAIRVGFVENYSIDYANLSSINADYKFRGVKTKSLKVMSMEI